MLRFLRFGLPLPLPLSLREAPLPLTRDPRRDAVQRRAGKRPAGKEVPLQLRDRELVIRESRRKFICQRVADRALVGHLLGRPLRVLRDGEKAAEDRGSLVPARELVLHLHVDPARAEQRVVEPIHIICLSKTTNRNVPRVSLVYDEQNTMHDGRMSRAHRGHENLAVFAVHAVKNIEEAGHRDGAAAGWRGDAHHHVLGYARRCRFRLCLPPLLLFVVARGERTVDVLDEEDTAFGDTVGRHLQSGIGEADAKLAIGIQLKSRMKPTRWSIGRACTIQDRALLPADHK